MTDNERERLMEARVELASVMVFDGMPPDGATVVFNPDNEADHLAVLKAYRILLELTS